MRERLQQQADVTHRSVAPPVVRWIEIADITAALRAGLDDFRAVPLYGALVGGVYALAGLVLVRATFDTALAALALPLVGGFALVAPVLAIGLYELSRRREQGLATRWWHAFGVRRHAAPGAILALAGLLAALLVAWLAVAEALYGAFLGGPPAGPGDLARQLFTTEAGWTLILAGHAVGAGFALVAFVLSAVSFPLLVDRDIGVVGAVVTSVRAVGANPLPMSLWALILAGGLVVGSAPLLLGLPVVLPILGHASWHVYRRVVLA